MHLINNYFQKSHLLLYPLLDLGFNAPFKPVNTFISYRNEVDIKRAVLICIYKPEYSKEYYEYRNNVLLAHNYFQKMITGTDKNILFFDLSLEHAKDFENFLEGTYSKFSINAKNKITEHYSHNELAAINIKSHIDPEEFHQYYADYLHVSLDLIVNNYETLTPPDLEKEHCK